MNLDLAFNQTEFFPFGTGKSTTDLFKSQNENLPKQNNELLKVGTKNSTSNDKLLFPKELITIFGENGKNRFDEFKSYQEGWYGGQGRKISRGSIFFLKQFANYLPELKLHRPSLFITLAGNLSIGFEDRNGKSVEIEFFSNKAEYYFESLEEEDENKLADIFELVEKVKSLLN